MFLISQLKLCHALSHGADAMLHMLRVEPQRSYGRFGSREERYGSIRVRLAMFASRATRTIAERTARHFSAV